MTSLALATSPLDSTSVLAVNAAGQLVQEPLASHSEAKPAAHYDQVIALCNPSAGHAEAEQALTLIVQPLFQQLSIPLGVYKTRHTGDATTFGQQLREREQQQQSGTTQQRSVLVIVLGGDGTTHELLQGLTPSSEPLKAQYQFALVPYGTANAVYHYLFPASSSKFASLAAALQSPRSRPLPLLQVRVNESKHIAHVVASTALHASILHDSEALRASVPGLERFKQAAQMNWTRTYRGSLQLSGQEVQRYAPSSKSFETCDREDAHTRDWVYINAVLTDRLEETFIVAPHRRPETTANSEILDVVSIYKPEKITTEQFSIALGKIVEGMYDGGRHVDLVWTKEGTVQPWADDSEGELVVQYWRCGGLSWKPDAESDPKSRLICVDGAIHTLDEGQAATIKMFAVDELRLCA